MTVNQGENIRSLQDELQSTPDTLDLLERDSRAFFHQTLSTPVFEVVTRAEGAYIYDGAGRRYLDLHGNGVHTVGYQHPKVLQAVRDQLDQALSFAPRRFTNLPAVLLAEKLARIAPGDLNRVLFCPGGSEAVEMAVMMAKLVTGRWKTLSYYGAFHGAGFQAVSIGADPHFRDGLGPMMPGALHLEMPDYYRNPWGWTDPQQIDEEYLRQVRITIENNPGIAALVTEPIFYNSTVPTAFYWQQVKALCEAHGILLIFDEIYTAFGRTGKMFACEHYDIVPDLLVVGKGFGGSILPFAGIIGRDDFNVLEHKSIGHFTHEKNPLCCAVARAVIDIVESERLVEKTAELGAYFKKGLLELQNEFEAVGQVTGLGLNLGLDLVVNRVSKQRATAPAQGVMQFCMARGISFKLIQGNILNLKPALVITRDEVDYVLETLREALKSATMA
jgi:4-aminobutyrate aminotransferase